MTTATSPVTDYTSLDYESAKSDLTRFAQSSAGLNLTDLNPSDPAVMLLNSLAYGVDLLAYSQDQRIREAIPTQAIRKVNFSAGAKGLGVYLRRSVAAVGELTFTVDYALTSPVGGPITVDENFKASTRGGLIFQPNTPTTIGPGVGIVNFTVAASEGDGTVDEAIGTSTGLAGQRYVLSGKPLIESTLEVSVAATLWTRVNLLALSLANAQEYAIEYANDGSVYILFGDGINGAVPSAAAAITATYKTGGGEQGNVEAATISQFVSTLAGVTAVTNGARFSGGADEQGLINAQANMPTSIAANSRCVTEADYAASTVEVSGVLKATADMGTAGGGGCGLPVVVYAIPSGGGSLSTPLKASIQTYLRTRKMAGTRILVKDANYVDMGVSIDVHVLEGSSAAAVKGLVSNAVIDQYDLTTVNFGDVLKLQDVYDLLTPSNIRGLSRVFVERFTVLGHTGQYRSAPYGNGTVTMVSDTGVDRREWRMEVTSPGSATLAGAFSVLQRYVGAVSELSDVTMGDDSADFPLSNGFVGGAWYLRINPYIAGSIPVLVTGNTEGSVTVSTPDLRAYGDIGDPYVVEHTETAVGKIYRETLAGPLTGGATVVALTGADWAVGDRLYVVDSAGVTHQTQITGGSSGAYTISPALPAAGLAAGSITFDAMWQSDDGTLRAVVRQGSLVWSSGDAFYIDTYEKTGDAAIRPTDFPRLTAANFVVRTIGGRA